MQIEFHLGALELIPTNRIAWSLALVLALAGSVSAQDKRLAISLEPLVPTCRSGAPLPIEWRCTWNGTGILEGEIQFDISDSSQRLGSFTTGTIVLSGGEQRFRQLLPPMEVVDQYEQADIEVRFVTKSQTIRLGNQSVRIPRRQQGVFAIAACDAWDIAVAAPAAILAQHLEMEQFDPQRADLNRPVTARPITTVSTRASPQSLPTDPLNYTGYDMVVVAGDGFGALRDSQLQALRQWVEAGGSLLISPTGALQGHHLAFLNGLIAKSISNSTPYTLDGNGRLVDSVSRSEETARRLRTGLGRTAILRTEALPDFETQDWLKTVKFLWKFRTKPVVSREKNLSAAASLALPRSSGNQFVRLLMPKTVHTLPLGWMGGILALYIACVGPLDYFLLGRLRMRKWTWVLFPVLTLAFAVSIVWMSNQTMQRGNVRKSVVILDVIEGNKVSRMNRFELLFLGSGQTAETQANRALFVPMNTQQYDLPEDLQIARQRGVLRSSLVSAPRYAGWIPGQCTVSQDIPQWTPQLNRMMTIAPAPADYPAGFDWDAISVADLDGDKPRQALQAKVQAAFGPEAAMYVLKKGQHFSGSTGPPVEWKEFGHQMAAPIYQLEAPPQHGLFQLISQLSPGGSANFTDLSLLDSNDSDQYLLSVQVPHQGELWIYRRIYRGDE